MTKNIPVAAAREIAEKYGYDQVVVVARKVGPAGVGREHVTTCGVDEPNCAVAARIGDRLKYQLMQWPVPDGYKLVPLVATEVMLKAGGHANSEWLNDTAPIGEHRYGGPVAASIWKDMIAAAPKDGAEKPA